MEIEGVIIKELKVHTDERGFFSEIVRKSDDIFSKGQFGQMSQTMSFAGAAKAWHLHKKQTDIMCVIKGDIKMVLYDTRTDSKTHKQLMEILLGENLGPKAVRIPPGVAHGYKVLNGPMYLVYITDREYDPTDELRIPHDDKSIGYDWTAPITIK
jgi:dTDP-4-dehydrorhamnose 3,5-epimerase